MCSDYSVLYLPPLPSALRDSRADESSLWLLRLLHRLLPRGYSTVAGEPTTEYVPWL